MTWFKIDDSFALHPKTLQCTASAGWLWVRAGSWSAQQTTDGFIPDSVVNVLGGKPKDIELLISIGLWEEVVGGYHFHDWLDYQPSRNQVESDRASVRERQRRSRAVTRESRVTRTRVAFPDPTLKRSNFASAQFAPPAAASAVAVRAEPAPPSTQTLIAEWVDHCPKRPPKRVLGQVSREISALLDEGIPPADVRAGLAVWHQRRLHPATLPAVIHEVRLGPLGRSTSGPNPASTTDQRVAGALALAQKLEREDAE